MVEKGLENLDKELSEVLPQKGVQKKEVRKVVPRQRKKGAVGKKVILTKARRKRAVARAVAKPGTGIVNINGTNVLLLKPKEIREMILEPIRIADTAEQLSKSYDISVSIRGGGVSGQAQAARSAIAKAMVSASADDTLKRVYLEYDRNLMVDDNRRVEPKKFKGPKARARFQKSYR